MNKFSDVLPRHETELLLSYILKCGRSDLYTKDIIIDYTIEVLFDSFVQRRLKGEPLQYITGHADFMGFDFAVREGVFIPRPETEFLVEEVLSAIRYTPYANRSLKILDLCTGSGNIAVTLAKLLPEAVITAADISETALETARENAGRHNVTERIKFYKGDLFKAFMFDKTAGFDIMVCNPPYIKSPDIDFLQAEVKQEPKRALDGGADGLGFYRRIANEAPFYLKKDGNLFLEIGISQLCGISGIFCRERSFRIRSVKKDFSGIERVVWIDLL